MRETAARLLCEGRVALVVGYEAGSVPFRTAPAFIRRPEEAARLVWNPFCTNNLAVYLPRLKGAGPIGLLAKGCDARSAVTLIQEHQLPREQVVILGLPCRGMAEVDRLAPPGVSLAELGISPGPDGGLLLAAGGREWSASLAELLQARCRRCEVTTPAVADELVGDPAPARSAAAEPLAAPAMSAAERRAFWRAQFERCLRCYACREACPACYCRSCFVEKAAPRWVSKAATADENWMYHATRAYHLAGRCVGCEECERACPVDIPLSGLNRRLAREVRERFGYVAGLDPEALPPLGTFRPEDPNPGETEAK